MKDERRQGHRGFGRRRRQLRGLRLLSRQGSPAPSTTLVPYRGGAPALQDIVAGNVDTMCDLAANSLAQVKAGTIKAYAVTAKKRWFAAPEVPTVDEAGAPGVEVTNWLAAYAPKGTPKDIVDKLNAAFRTAMADPAVRQRIADQGLEIPPPEQQTPEAFAAYLKAEMDKWGAVIRESGIKIAMTPATLRAGCGAVSVRHEAGLSALLTFRPSSARPLFPAGDT